MRFISGVMDQIAGLPDDLARALTAATDAQRIKLKKGAKR